MYAHYNLDSYYLPQFYHTWKYSRVELVAQVVGPASDILFVLGIW